jgi:hypothetical protein
MCLLSQLDLFHFWVTTATDLDTSRVPQLPLIEAFIDVQLLLIDNDHKSALVDLKHAKEMWCESTIWTATLPAKKTWTLITMMRMRVMQLS